MKENKNVLRVRLGIAFAGALVLDVGTYAAPGIEEKDVSSSAPHAVTPPGLPNNRGLSRALTPVPGSPATRLPPESSDASPSTPSSHDDLPKKPASSAFPRPPSRTPAGESKPLDVDALRKLIKDQEGATPSERIPDVTLPPFKPSLVPASRQS